jgi:hypothetical protein
MPINIFGTPNLLGTEPSGMSLFIEGPESAYVYNSVGMNVYGVTDFNSGIMNLVTWTPSGTANSGVFNLSINSGPPKNNLNLNVRGR